MESIKKIILTVGLSGCGKTHFCKEYLRKHSNLNVNHIEFDECKKISCVKSLSFDSALIKCMKEYQDEVLLIDMSLITNNDVIKALETLSDNLENISNMDIEIHFWKEDKDLCIHNNKGRKCDNTKLFNNINFEKIDVEQIKKSTSLNNINIIEHTTERKSELQVALDSLSNENVSIIYNESDIEIEKYLYSKEWMIYDDLDVEKSENKFNLLDNLLKVLCPLLTFANYQELMDIAVDIEEFEKDEFYQYTTYRRWRCDLIKLEDYLKSKNYIS